MDVIEIVTYGYIGMNVSKETGDIVVFTCAPDSRSTAWPIRPTCRGG